VALEVRQDATRTIRCKVLFERRRNDSSRPDVPHFTTQWPSCETTGSPFDCWRLLVDASKKGRAAVNRSSGSSADGRPVLSSFKRGWFDVKTGVIVVVVIVVGRSAV
jgi:hypothetical protein